MAIQGLRDTGIAAGGTSAPFADDQRPLNWRDGILLLFPNGRAPLTALTSAMRKKVTDDPEFKWWDKALDDQRVALGANAGLGTTLTLAAGGNTLKVGHVLYVEQTGEYLRVTGVTSDTSITVARAQFGGPAATDVDYDGINVNPYLLVIGSAYEEGSSKPTAIAYDPVKRTNYTQIFRNNLAATRTAMKTRLRTGDAVREAKREALQYHSIEMEKAFWFGRPSEQVINGKPLRTTGGIFYWIAQGTAQIPELTQDFSGGSTTMTQLEDALEAAFRFGSSEKMAFAGNRAVKVVQRIARLNSDYEFMQGQKEFGMNVNRLISPFGELVIKTHPLWNQVTSGENPTTGGGDFKALDSWVAILDMENLIYRPLSDSDTKFMGDQADPGDDAMEAGYLTECGLELHHQTTFSVWKGLTSAATG